MQIIRKKADPSHEHNPSTVQNFKESVPLSRL